MTIIKILTENSVENITRYSPDIKVMEDHLIIPTPDGDVDAYYGDIILFDENLLWVYKKK